MFGPWAADRSKNKKSVERLFKKWINLTEHPTAQETGPLQTPKSSSVGYLISYLLSQTEIWTLPYCSFILDRCEGYANVYIRGSKTYNLASFIIHVEFEDCSILCFHLVLEQLRLQSAAEQKQSDPQMKNKTSDNRIHLTWKEGKKGIFKPQMQIA